jgi:hypothetical protein
VGTPGRLHTLLTVESVTVHALNPVTSAADLAQRSREGLPRMTQRHEQPVANGQLNVNNADSARLGTMPATRAAMCRSRRYVRSPSLRQHRALLEDQLNGEALVDDLLVDDLEFHG